MKNIVLIDGNNLLFRSYYATAYNGNIMKNSKGFPTNAIYGLINMLNKIITEEKPEYIMVAFDKGKTFRHDKYKLYKDGRSETPIELKEQFPVAKKIVTAMGIIYMEIDNYEADDIIGTLAQRVSDDDEYNGVIISSDKDLLQLIKPDVEVKLLKQTGFVRMTEEEFINIYGIEPIKMIDLKALMGDSSDNIPGVKGVGEKTALSLLKEYSTLENLYCNIETVKGKVKDKLIESKENAFMSKDLATICLEVPLEYNWEDLKYKGVNTQEYIEILEDLEFYSLIKKLDIKKETKRSNIDELIGYKIINNKEELNNLTIDKDYAIYIEILGDNYHKNKPIGISIYNEETSIYIPFEVLKENIGFLNNNNNKFTYDAKKLMVILNNNNIEYKNISFDTMIACYLLNKNLKDDIAYLANNMGYNIPFYEDIFKSKTVNTKLKEPTIEILAETCIKKAKFIYDTKNSIMKDLEKEELLNLHDKIEFPLIEVLADMETTGILIDKTYLEQMQETLKKEIDKLEQEIHDLSGSDFNVNSPKQLGEILFEKLMIPYPKKIKDNNYSTSKDILDKLVMFPIIDKILEYRTLNKIYTTYIIGLLNEIKEDGKIHTIYNQTLTRTGRLSSVAPNLQNIPIRQEYGRLVRKAFIASENCILASSDYSQIELRIFAHVSNAENLIEAFINNKDIHTKTASDIFGIEEEQVTKDMRRSAKAVNFGILYGISSFGLSEDLKIDMSKAKEFIERYLEKYPEIKKYMTQTIEQAHKNGYVKTIMNRKRTIEELNNKNYMIRSQGERMALNTPIQGSSSDILKKAMIEIYYELNQRNFKSKMLLQVHDELVFEVVKEEEKEVLKIIKEIMENTYKLDVPLIVEIEKGPTWYDAK